MQEIISQIEKELKRDLLPKLKVFKDFRIIKIYRKKQRYLGYYVNDSYRKPIIKLNIPQIYSACQEYNVKLATGIYSTILHEIAHAIQEYKNKPIIEEQAELFAYRYYSCDEILKI